jgi:signal transduction histidine kinase
MVIMLAAVPGLIALVAEPGRAAVARGAGRLLSIQAGVLDRDLALALKRAVLESPRAGGSAVRLRVLGAALATALVFAPLSFLVILAGAVGVVILAAAPILVQWDQVSFFDAAISRQSDAFLLCLLSVPVAVLLLFAVAGLALVQITFLRSLVAEALEEEVEELKQSRDHLMDAFDTERQRIESMLHDGVQHRLVALAMTLGLAEATAPTPEQRSTLAVAHRQADEALAELRRVIRGVLPRALTERGLVPAVEDLIADTPLPVENRIQLTERLPRRVEQVSYFLVSEALSNVMKHAGATRAVVSGDVRDGVWTLTVDDDGCGGALVRPGGGLDGLRRRSAALGGTLEITDRDGGGTRVTMTCPTGDTP